MARPKEGDLAGHGDLGAVHLAQPVPGAGFFTTTNFVHGVTVHASLTRHEPTRQRRAPLPALQHAREPVYLFAHPASRDSHATCTGHPPLRTSKAHEYRAPRNRVPRRKPRARPRPRGATRGQPRRPPGNATAASLSARGRARPPPVRGHEGADHVDRPGWNMAPGIEGPPARPRSRRRALRDPPSGAAVALPAAIRAARWRAG